MHPSKKPLPLSLPLPHHLHLALLIKLISFMHILASVN
jgi:hypothetical protein